MNKQHAITALIGVASVALCATFFVLNRPKSAAASDAPPSSPGTTIPNVPAEPEEPFISEPIQPIPIKINLDKRKVKLGRLLFSDVRLSGDNTLSCNSCHNLLAGGADGKVVSTGIKGSAGEINAPTVLNSGLNFKQFWDGRADTLEAQVDGPTHNPKEMGSSWPEIVGKLETDTGYVKAFKELYPDGIQAANIRDAIATFERSLITPNSRFDKYLRGDKSAITEDERKGYQNFKDLGCVACHQGMNAGGNMFQPFGVMADYFAARGNPTKADQGRFNVTGQPQDKHKFKVPGLRNVELTAPYFHDGSARTLEEAVRVMVQYQLAQEITEVQVGQIVAFLKTLTGEQTAP